jgi:hypothetical protein
MKNITNKNSKGESHGYQEVYYNTNNIISFRGNRKKGNPIGYAEYHGSKRTRYYIK